MPLQPPQAVTHRLGQLVGLPEVVVPRAGDFPQALANLQESCRAYKRANNTSDEDGVVEDQIFLALTYHRLAKPEEAKKWLAKAVASRKVAEQDADSKPSVWQRAEWSLLRHEAEKLIGPAQ